MGNTRASAEARFVEVPRGTRRPSSTPTTKPTRKAPRGKKGVEPTIDSATFFTGRLSKMVKPIPAAVTDRWGDRFQLFALSQDSGGVTGVSLPRAQAAAIFKRLNVELKRIKSQSKRKPSPPQAMRMAKLVKDLRLLMARTQSEAFCSVFLPLLSTEFAHRKVAGIMKKIETGQIRIPYSVAKHLVKLGREILPDGLPKKATPASL